MSLAMSARRMDLAPMGLITMPAGAARRGQRRGTRQRSLRGAVQPRHGQPARHAPGQLAEQLGLTTGAVTKLLDRLQQAGYVTRSADPADRRRIIVAADPQRLSELAE